MRKLTFDLKKVKRKNASNKDGRLPPGGLFLLPVDERSAQGIRVRPRRRHFQSIGWLSFIF